MNDKNLLQCTGKPCTANNYLVQNVNSTKTEKLCFRKYKLIYSDEKNISDCLGVEDPGGTARKEYKRPQDNFRSDGYIHYLDFNDHFMGVYLCQN